MQVDQARTVGEGAAPGHESGDLRDVLERDQRGQLHDLRASLAGIAAAAAVLTRQNQTLSTDEVGRLAGMVESEVRRLGRMVGNRGPGANERLLDDAIDAVVVPRRLTGQVIDWEPGGQQVRCAADPLAEVLNTLLVNVEMHAPGARSVIASSILGDAVRVTVTDDGPGIPAELRSSVFEPGAHASGSLGEGLGLWMARNLLVQRGGTLQLLDAQDGQGAAFAFTLPCSRVQEPVRAVVIEDVRSSCPNLPQAGQTRQMDLAHTDLLAAIDLRELGSRLRAARTAAGLTQSDLAGDEVSVGYVSRIESGQRRPTAEVLAGLARRLDTSVEQLLTGVSGSTLDQIRLSLDYAELSLESGEPGEAMTQADRAGELAEAAGQAQMADRARFLQARATEMLGGLDDAIIAYEELVGRFAGVLRAEVGIALCRCYRESGDLTKAVEIGEEMLAHLAEICLDQGDEAVRMSVTLAAAYFERGDVSHAVRICRVAADKAEKLDSPHARASAYWNASLIQARQGSVSEAVTLAERALALLAEGEDTRNLARLRSQLGGMQLSMDPPRVREAEANLRQAAEDLAWSSAGTLDVARNQVTLARAVFLAGDLELAEQLTLQVHELVGDRAPLLMADAKMLEGEIRAAQGRTADSALAYREAVLLLSGIGADRSAGQLWFDLAGLLEEVGDLDAARQAYRSAAVTGGFFSRRAARSGARAASQR